MNTFTKHHTSGRGR